jgi:5-methylcytosine-specific restriction enzyme A
MPQAWAGSDRRAHLPSDWPAIRKRVLARDRGRCQIHGPTCQLVATEVDHLNGDRNDHRMENLQSVCSVCHGHKSSAEGHAARKSIAARSTRPTEPHPGLIG